MKRDSINEESEEGPVLNYGQVYQGNAFWNWLKRHPVLFAWGCTELGGIAIFALGGAFDQREIAGSGFFICVGAVPAFFAGSLFAGWRKMTSWQDQSEEEFNKQWERRDVEKRDALAIARKVYANGPVGTWRYEVVEKTLYTGPILHEKRELRFGMDGKGLYEWRLRGDHPATVDVLFEYKRGEGDEILVQMKSPKIEGWHDVQYGFETKREDGELELIVWFESENPMLAEFKDYWPFHGQFKRVAR